MTALHSQDYKDVIERIIALRRRLGLSQEELARRLPRYGDGHSAGQLQSFVSKFEQRQRRLDFIEFMHLCHVLGVRTCDLLDEHRWTGEPPPAIVPDAREPLLQDGGPRPQHPSAPSNGQPGPSAEVSGALRGASVVTEAPLAQPLPHVADGDTAAADPPVAPVVAVPRRATRRKIRPRG